MFMLIINLKSFQNSQKEVCGRVFLQTYVIELVH